MYIGNQAVDNIYIGSNPVDAVYLGNTQVWSAIPAAVKAHIARVTADGGTVPEQAKMVSMVKALMAAGLWDSCVFCAMPIAGVKADGNQFVSKMYDLKANADLLQATGTEQPKYNNGSLLYDGGDRIASELLDSSNAIRTISNKMSAFVKYNATTSVNHVGIFGRWNMTGNTTSNWMLYKTATTNYLYGYVRTGSGNKIFATTQSITGENIIGMTFDGSIKDVGGTNYGHCKIYVNGTQISSTPNGYSITSLINNTTEIAFSPLLTNKLTNLDTTSIAVLFAKVLSPSEVSTLNTIMQAV